MNKTEEIWVDISGYEGIYQISSYGTIKSLGRFIEYTSCLGNVFHKWLKEHDMVPVPDHRGYMITNLTRKDRSVCTPHIHKLVALAFLPPKTKEQTEINHIDGVPANNHHTNLEWCTHQENMTHASETGLIIGRDNRQKLAFEDAVRIRYLYGTGQYSQWDIARMFNIDQSHVNNILKNRTWKTNTRKHFKKA